MPKQMNDLEGAGAWVPAPRNDRESSCLMNGAEIEQAGAPKTFL